MPKITDMERMIWRQHSREKVPPEQAVTNYIYAATAGDLAGIENFAHSYADYIDVAKGEDELTALAAAAAAHELPAVNLLLMLGADINNTDSHGRTILMTEILDATREEPYFILRYIIAGADLDMVDDDGRSALMLAVRRGDLRVVNMLLDHDASKRGRDINRHSVYDMATAHRDPWIRNSLLEALNKKRETAAEKKRRAALQTLAEGVPRASLGSSRKISIRKKPAEPFNEASTNQSDGRRQKKRPAVKRQTGIAIRPPNNPEIDAFVQAAARNDFSNVDLYLKAFGSAYINAETTSYERAGVAAARNGLIDMLDHLLKRGAGYEHQTTHSPTLLVAAVRAGRGNVVDHLFDVWKVNPDTPLLGNHETALHAAALSARTDMVEKLLSRKANVDARTVSGMTPLIAIAQDTFTDETTRIEIAKILLAHKADIDAVDNDGRTAMMHALRYGQLDLVDALFDLGADPDIKDHAGKTAMDYAAEHGHIRYFHNNYEKEKKFRAERDRKEAAEKKARLRADFKKVLSSGVKVPKADKPAPLVLRPSARKPPGSGKNNHGGHKAA